MTGPTTSVALPAQTILANAKALVKTGLAAHGYNTVTIDDCWMQKDRDAQGNLQADPQRFPQGMKPIADRPFMAWA